MLLSPDKERLQVTSQVQRGISRGERIRDEGPYLFARHRAQLMLSSLPPHHLPPRRKRPTWRSIINERFFAIKDRNRSYLFALT